MVEDERPGELERAETETERGVALDALEQGDAVIVLDRDLRIVLVNANEERLSRRSRAELMGRSLWEAFPEAATGDAQYRAVIDRVMRDRSPETFDEYYRPLDLWTAVSVRPMRHGGVALFVRDVTHRKRAEQALRAQEAFASRILASSLNGIYVMDLQSEEAVFVNARYVQLTGYTLDDLRAFRGRVLDALFHPDDRDRMRTHLAALARARDGEVLDVEYRFRARDGRFITCFSRETPFARTDDGLVRQLIGTFVDVTELRRAEDSARESERRYRALFDSMTEGFALLEVLCDAGGVAVDARFVEVNPAFEQLTGISRARVEGARLGEIAPEERDFWMRTYGPVALTGTPAHVERRWERLGRDCDVYAFAPRPGHLAMVFVDVTERRRVEQALRDADRRKDEFLAILSHELRNPLAPIASSVHVLDRAPPESPAAARARSVLGRQTAHLARLVDDLLDVTRISRGKIVLRRSRVDARALVLRACEDHRSMFEQDGIELRCEVGDGAAWVDADATRLVQIVGNLLQNAVRFTNAGGTVAVSTAASDGRLELRVRDTGIGMEPYEVDRMFEPFAQAERGLARTPGGLGLGLALVKGLVERHGGAVTARSEGPGRGTEVVVTLPLAAAPAPAPGVEAAPPGGGRLVLVVEDNADARDSLADVLELGGHRVRVAPDGHTAITLAHELRPDVVICDIGLPDMTGYDVARALRHDGALRGMRLIALSGYVSPEDRARALDTGFDAHLAKPPTIEALEALVSAPT